MRETADDSCAQDSAESYTRASQLLREGSGNEPVRMDRDDKSAVNILMRFLARRGPHTRLAECGVLQATQSGVEVKEASCEGHVQQLNLFDGV